MQTWQRACKHRLDGLVLLRCRAWGWRRGRDGLAAASSHAFIEWLQVGLARIGTHQDGGHWNVVQRPGQVETRQRLAQPRADGELGAIADRSGAWKEAAWQERSH
jgi:hypothetical protein